MNRLRISRLINEYRAKPRVDRAATVDALELLASYFFSVADHIAEVEIKPPFLLPQGVSAVDVLMCVARASATAASA